LGIVLTLLYVSPLFLDAPLTDPDEGLHAAISQEMVERGDVIVPRFLGTPFLDKPILFFWAQAASLHVFGMHTASARLPGVLFAILGIATTGWLAWVLFSGVKEGETERARMAAVCYATMVLPFLLAQAPVHDMAIVPFANLALGALWRARAPGRECGRYVVLAGVALGLSILTKGLAAVAIVGIGYTAYLLVTRSLDRRLLLQGLLVLMIAAGVALPWYAAMEAREPGYLNYYFADRHLLGFTTGSQRHSGQPWWYYVPLLAGGGLPWIVSIARGRLRARRSEAEKLLWVVLASTILLLTIAGSKAVTYLLPVMPLVAIVAVRSLTVRTWRTVSMGTAAIFSAALLVFGPQLAHSRSSRDLARYFNAARSLPSTVFVFDQRVGFVFYLDPDVRRQLGVQQVRSVSVEELMARHAFPGDAAVAVPADLAASRLGRVPWLANATRHAAGRYLVVTP
jgi:4-amino-4-deoxy-L-arabinose transferase-like glycosyltransferase